MSTHPITTLTEMYGSNHRKLHYVYLDLEKPLGLHPGLCWSSFSMLSLHLQVKYQLHFLSILIAQNTLISTHMVLCNKILNLYTNAHPMIKHNANIIINEFVLIIHRSSRNLNFFGRVNSHVLEKQKRTGQTQHV